MEADVLDFIITFTSILWEAFPFIVLGALVAGFLEEMVPQQAIAKIVPKSKIVAIMIGGGLGLIFPMCECGIVPVMRRLLRKGLPLGTCIAYMLAGPIINLVVIFSTWVAFGNHGYAPQMVAMRVGMGFLVACVTAAMVEFFLLPKHGASGLLTSVAVPPQAADQAQAAAPPVSELHPAEHHAETGRSFWQRLNNISETALHDFKDIMVFLIIGALLAAFAKLHLTQDQIASVSTSMPAIAILCMMGLAIVMCLCSEADAFVAASFTTLHPSAKLSFLVLGPMFDLKLLLMFTRVFRARLIITIALCVVVQVFVLSLAAHYLWEAMDWPTSAIEAQAAEAVTPVEE